MRDTFRHALRRGAVVVALPVLAALVPAAAGAQAPTCQAGSIFDYFLLGSNGCTLGGIQFTNFQVPFLTNPDWNTYVITPAEAMVGAQHFAGFTLSFNTPVAITSDDATGEGNFRQASRLGTFTWNMHPLDGATFTGIAGSGIAGAYSTSPFDGSEFQTIWSGQLESYGSIYNPSAAAYVGVTAGVYPESGTANQQNSACGSPSVMPDGCVITAGDPSYVVPGWGDSQGQLAVSAFLFGSLEGDTWDGSAYAEIGSGTVMYAVSDVETAPEPSAILLIGTGLLAAGVLARVRRATPKSASPVVM